MKPCKPHIAPPVIPSRRSAAGTRVALRGCAEIGNVAIPSPSFHHRDTEDTEKERQRNGLCALCASVVNSISAFRVGGPRTVMRELTPLAVGYGRAVPNPGRMGERVSRPPTGIRHGAAVPYRNRDEVYNKESDKKGIPEIIIPGSTTVPSTTSSSSSRRTSRNSSTTSRSRTSARSNEESPAHRRARLRRAELPWVVAVRCARRPRAFGNVRATERSGTSARPRVPRPRRYPKLDERYIVLERSIQGWMKGSGA
jgi:hypothetical protein